MTLFSHLLNGFKWTSFPKPHTPFLDHVHHQDHRLCAQWPWTHFHELYEHLLWRCPSDDWLCLPGTTLGLRCYPGVTVGERCEWNLNGQVGMSCVKMRPLWHVMIEQSLEKTRRGGRWTVGQRQALQVVTFQWHGTIYKSENSKFEPNFPVYLSR